MSVRSEVLLWAQRVIARKGGPAHTILEVRADVTPEQAQAAFHKLARAYHPDLHRSGLTPEELEMVTSAYACVAGAYQTLRTQASQTLRMRPLKPEDVAAVNAAPVPAPASVPPSSSPRSSAGAASAANAAQSMSSKALVYYRKAELSLKRGDLKGAVLQIKLAIAADPNSAFLRAALAEVDLELRKGT